MIFPESLTVKQQIDLLERSILVNAYCYYEMNDNILSDRQYDMNALQFEDLKNKNPGAFRRSNYYEYFIDFESGTGFDLVSKIKSNRDLCAKIERDTILALKLSRRARS